MICLDTSVLVESLIPDAAEHDACGNLILHLAAARKAKCDTLYTLNVSDFVAFHRDGDPEIKRP
jgi:predicted nucleic acid-binding protein